MGAALRVDLGAEKGSVAIVRESGHCSGNYIEDPCGVVSYTTHSLRWGGGGEYLQY